MWTVTSRVTDGHPGSATVAVNGQSTVRLDSDIVETVLVEIVEKVSNTIPDRTPPSPSE